MSYNVCLTDTDIIENNFLGCVTAIAKKGYSLKPYFKKEVNMQKKLTISIDSKIYDGLYAVIGKRKISKFIEDIVRPHVIKQDLDNAYKLMVEDAEREADALEWSEGTPL